MKLFDAHCHLPEGCIDSMLARANAAGVVGMAVCIDFSKHWKNSPSFFQGLEAGSTGGPIIFQSLEKYPQIFPMVGIHPWSVEGRDGSPNCPWRAEDSTPYLWETEFQCLEKTVRKVPNLGIGETGLDFSSFAETSADAKASADAEAMADKMADKQEKFTNRVEQEASFAAHLDLARELNRPVTVHCVQAWGRLIEILKEHPAPRILLHAFGGAPELIPELVELNCWFSFGEAVMNPNAKRVRASAVAVPADRLLIETDSIDEPEVLVDVAHTVAELRGVPVEEIAELTFENAKKIFS